MMDPIGIQRHSARKMTEPAQEDVRKPLRKNCQVRMVVLNQTYLAEHEQNGDDGIPGPVEQQSKQLQREGAEDH